MDYILIFIIYRALNFLTILTWLVAIYLIHISICYKCSHFFLFVLMTLLLGQTKFSSALITEYSTE